MRKSWNHPSWVALILFVWLACAHFLFAANVTKGPPSHWVQASPYAQTSTLDEEELFGGVIYLLFDRQIQVESQAHYTRAAIEFTSSEGVEEFSEISVNYDPSFQKVIFHEVKLLRDGEWINKLAKTAIQTLQRETDADRHIYDGSETAMITLSDVRKGDLLEYSYTIVGRNPLFKGKFYGTWYTQMWYPVADMRLRFIAPADRQLNFQTYPNERKADLSKVGKNLIYQWNSKNTTSPEWESNLPAHLNLFERVEVSEMKSWAEVNRWALGHFKTSAKDKKAIQELLPGLSKGLASQLEYGTVFTKWVQNEIRYLGLEDGIGGYKPRAPANVIEDRFGDCKDKSLLLSSMLQAKGIDAWPMLVHSSNGKVLDEHLPHPLNFNHCVVYVEYGDSAFTIDPTIKMQGDLFGEMYCPNYGWGLVIREGEKALTKLKGKGEYFIRIESELNLNGPGDAVNLKVKTIYRGEAADGYRMQLANQSENDIEKSYRDFYRKFYKQVEVKKNFTVIDTDTLGNNQVEIVEQYLIGDMWQVLGDSSSGNWQVEVAPLELFDYLYTNEIAGRTLPFALRYPMHIEQNLKFRMDDFIPIKMGYNEFIGPGFEYGLKTYSYPGFNVLDYRYEILKPEIPADSVALFYQRHEELTEEITYILTQQKPGATGSNPWTGLTWLLSIVSFAVIGFAYWKWGWRHDPQPKIPLAESRSLGGWFLLPIIGMIIGTISTIVQLGTGDLLFNRHELGALLSSDPNVYDPAYGWFGIFTSLLTILVTILMVGNLMLILQRRTNVPRLMALYYISNFLTIAIFSIGASYFQNQGYLIEPMATSVWFGRIFALAVWMPFFLISHQSQGTFVVALKNHYVEPPRPKSSIPPIRVSTPPPIPGLEEEE